MRILFAVVFFSVLAAPAAHAARAVVEPGATPMTVDAFLLPEREGVNAVSGELVFPSDALSLSEVRDANSVITLWIEAPHETSPGVVSFAGITPGGYAGDKGFLFALSFVSRGTSSGDVHLSFRAFEALRNDGNGTPVSVALVPATLPLSADVSEREHEQVRPEPFIPVRVQDAGLFDGAPFLVFVTQDKGSGMKGYEVCEGIFGRCTEAESPHRLVKPNALITRVHALDRDGNVRSAWLFTSLSWQWLALTALTLILIVILCFIFWRVRRH